MLVICIYSLDGERKMLETAEFMTASETGESTELKVTVRVPQDEGKTYAAESFLWNGTIMPLG